MPASDQCIYDPCDRPVRARSGPYGGYCAGHTVQIKEGRELRPLRYYSPRSASLEERLLHYTEKQEGGCWIWTGATNGSYGVLQVDAVTHFTHRLSYAEWVGKLKPGAVIHHRCGQKLCLRPEHLQQTSHHANLAESLVRQEALKHLEEAKERYEALARHLLDRRIYCSRQCLESLGEKCEESSCRALPEAV